jgi:hypothetical protein
MRIELPNRIPDTAQNVRDEDVTYLDWWTRNHIEAGKGIARGEPSGRDEAAGEVLSSNLDDELGRFAYF